MRRTVITTAWSALIGALVCGAPPAAAQAPSAPLVLSLDEAVARGLAASHLIVESAARYDAATAGVEEQRSVSRPQVGVQAGYTRTNHVEEFGFPNADGTLRVFYPDIPDNLLTRLDVRWPVYSGGRAERLEQAAVGEAAASGLDVDGVRADLTLAITRAYWTVVTARTAEVVLDGSLASSGAHLRDARNQLEVGLVPPNDVFAAEAQDAHQRMLSIQARVARENAEADLARLVGVRPGTPIQTSTDLATPDDAFSLVMLPDPAVLARDALTTRPERAALVERLHAAEARLAAARAGRRPTVSVGGGLDYGRPNARIFPREGAWQESWDASVNVHLPILDGGRTDASSAGAAAAVAAIQARIDEFDSVLAVEIGQRLRDIEGSRAAIAAAEASVRAATEAHRIAGERFTAGAGTGTDVITAQGALLGAELDRAQALAAVRLAEARLRRALGR